MHTSVASMFSLSSRDHVHFIQSAIASSPYYLHVLSSYFANITTRVSSYAAAGNELVVASWTLEPAHILMMDTTHELVCPTNTRLRRLGISWAK